MVFMPVQAINQKNQCMKAQFIKLETVTIKSETDGEIVDRSAEDTSVIINANNISSIRRINYNDTIQTMVLMVGGERFGVHELPEEIVEMIDHSVVSYA
jgi:hypothetical protein